MGRSRSRSRSRGRFGGGHGGGGGAGGRRGRYSSRSRSLSPYDDGHRVHVADIGLNPAKPDVLEVFEKYGPITEVWVARNPPCFAFVIFRHIDDAERAIRDCDGKYVNVFGSRIRVSFARPRTRGQRRKHGFDPNLRCYQCGDKGHFSRDCSDVARERRRGRSRSRSRGHRDSNRRGSRHSRSRSRHRSRSRSKDKTKRNRSRSKSRSKSKSRSPSKSKSRERKIEDIGNGGSPTIEKSIIDIHVEDTEGKWKGIETEGNTTEDVGAE